MRDNYKLRVVLCLVDLEDNETALLEVNKMVLMSKCTLILAWTVQEAARYLETYKAYENKPANSIKEKIQTEYIPQLTDILTTIRSVNKTDVMILASTFGSLKAIMGASMEELALCPGLGEKKVRRIYDAFHCSLDASAQKQTST
jgi:DNA excision repair protein ERCC-1